MSEVPQNSEGFSISRTACTCILYAVYVQHAVYARSQRVGIRVKAFSADSSSRSFCTCRDQFFYQYKQ